MTKKGKVRHDATAVDAERTEHTWDLPPYKSLEFFSIIPRDMLYDFRTWPVCKFAVEAGLIRDDEWVGERAAKP